jgi:hypothetical protein
MNKLPLDIQERIAALLAGSPVAKHLELVFEAMASLGIKDWRPILDEVENRLKSKKE